MKDAKIVTIGGGTGSSVLLAGLKNYTKEITAIVTVADDGGSSGMLREDLGMLPPGDIRSCLIALSNSEEEMAKLMAYRFGEGDGHLAGHCFGNIFLAALSDIYGDFESGLRAASKVLAITGKVLPMTLDNVVLYAQLEDGSIIEGEYNITFLTRQKGGKIDRVYLEPDLSKPPLESLDEIKRADLIVLGPGSLYTSIMPNLLINDLCQAIKDSKAKKVYISNVMTQAGETDNYKSVDHLNAINKHCSSNFIDYIFVNTSQVPKRIAKKYFNKDKSLPIYISDEEIGQIEAIGTKVIMGDFLDISYDYVKHNAENISIELMRLLDR